MHFWKIWNLWKYLESFQSSARIFYHRLVFLKVEKRQNFVQICLDKRLKVCVNFINCLFANIMCSTVEMIEAFKHKTINTCSNERTVESSVEFFASSSVHETQAKTSCLYFSFHIISIFSVVDCKGRQKHMLSLRLSSHYCVFNIWCFGKWCFVVMVFIQLLNSVSGLPSSSSHR